MTPKFPRRWSAVPQARQLLNYWCDECKRWIPAGNSSVCGGGDHERGEPVFPDWNGDLPVENIGDVLRACGYPQMANFVEGKLQVTE